MLKIESFFYLFTLFRVGYFLSVAYLTVANLARLGISVYCQVPVRSQYSVRLLSQCWITGGHTIHPPIEGLLPPRDIEPTPFQNSTFKVAGLQVHDTTPVTKKALPLKLTQTLNALTFVSSFLIIVCLGVLDSLFTTSDLCAGR